jgi:GDP-L-fucose synthase|tara:strand:+ start:411 stop:1355 length:945 start_codon:yes stop_codon:yes gene_type:complete
MNQSLNKILITGGTGMLGKAFEHTQEGREIIQVGSSQWDLTRYDDALDMFETIRPTACIHLAARVGGVKANTNNMADFCTDNFVINTNVLKAANHTGVTKVLSLLSTCVYPDNALYPLTEDQIHAGPPHSSNFGYAYAKRMLDVQSRAYRQQYGCNFITAVPNNLFGENDNYDLENSHVIPAIMRKMHEAKLSNERVVLWGDGSPMREFTYSKDLASILLFLLENYDDPEPINVGNTKECTIREVAEMIAEIVGFTGEIIWDISKPMGQHRKPSDNSKLTALGWGRENYTDLRKSLTETYKWVILNYPHLRGIV